MQVKGRDLGALAHTCKFFYKTSLVDKVAQEQLRQIPRAKGVKPDPRRVESR